VALLCLPVTAEVAGGREGGGRQDLGGGGLLRARTWGESDLWLQRDIQEPRGQRSLSGGAASPGTSRWSSPITKILVQYNKLYKFGTS
jgi:hypothetical protein